MKLFSRADQSFLGTWWWTVDRGLLSAALVLLLFGVLLITTASPPVAETIGLGQYHFLKRHFVMLVPALGILLGVSMLERRQAWRLASLVFVGAIVAMVLVLLTGSEVKGAQRWIRVLGFSLQPSEFVKPAFIIVCAWLINLKTVKENFPGHLVMTGLYFLVITLLLLQPDFGMTFLVSFVWGVQIFLSGFPLRYILMLVGAGIVGLVGIYFSLDHVKSRIDRFLDPASGDTFQIERSVEAFQSGGIAGAGPGQGVVKLSLPDAHADFIFSVAAEEMGFIFIMIILAVYGFILLRGFKRLAHSEDLFVVLAAGGLLTLMGLQAFIHMGSSLNLLPAKGMTLPFVSYGGSSLLGMAFAFGMILALTRRAPRSSIAKGGLSKGLRS